MTPSPGVSPRRQKLYWLILFSVPLLILGGTELALRIFDYGGNLDLVVKKTILGKEYYALNREVARRYFSQRGIAVPEVYDDVFEIIKRPTTKRIFMLGESTMAGYPYDYNATAPRLLRDRLTQLLPQYNIEVINVGLAAINSYTVLDFVEELVEYEPDLFIVYLGHNEFYGALGIGSTEYLGQWRWLVNAYIAMRKFRLFLLVRDGLVALRNVVRSDPTPRDVTLMEVMVREHAIRHHGREYNIARDNFAANLLDMINAARQRGISIVLSTLASNLRDQPPLLPTFSEMSTEDQRKQWQATFELGRRLQTAGQHEEAVRLFTAAIGIDSMHADAHFHLGRCLEHLGRYDAARHAYKQARDLDGLRFRASSDFNALILDLCRQRSVPVADVEAAFEQHSPNGLIGQNLMLEHLHPNFDGYFLMAKTFLQTVVDNRLLVPPEEWRWERNLTDDGYRERAGVTGLELEAAKFRIFQLTRGWPFQKNEPASAAFVPADRIQELAVDYVRKRLAWSQAHYDLADWYIKNGQYANALREFHAVSKVIPYYYFPFMRMGDMCRLMKDNAKALEWYRHGLTLQDSPFLRVRLGMVYFEEEKVPEAIEQFEATFTAEERGAEKMSVKDRSTARYFLAAAYGKNGNLEKARANLLLAVQIDPGNSEARKMLERIQYNN